MSLTGKILIWSGIDQVLTLNNRSDVYVAVLVFNGDCQHKWIFFSLWLLWFGLWWHNVQASQSGQWTHREEQVRKVLPEWICVCSNSQLGRHMNVPLLWRQITCRVSMTSSLPCHSFSDWCVFYRPGAGPVYVPTRALLRMLRTLVCGLVLPLIDSGCTSSLASSTMFIIFPRASFPRVSMTEANCTWRRSEVTGKHNKSWCYKYDSRLSDTGQYMMMCITAASRHLVLEIIMALTDFDISVRFCVWGYQNQNHSYSPTCGLWVLSAVSVHMSATLNIYTQHDAADKTIVILMF